MQTGLTAGTTYTSIRPDQAKGVITDRNIKQPSTFSGDKEKDSIEFEPWLQNMELVLSNASFKTREDALRFVHSFTTGQAWSMMQSRVLSSSAFVPTCLEPFESVEAMLQELYDQYGDRDADTRAFTTLSNMKQTVTESFYEFYARWTKYRSRVRMEPSQEITMIKERITYTYASRLINGT
jgi:hypothetical protein